MRHAVLLCLFAFAVFSATAQDRVPRELQGIHVFATVPLIGTGTPADPKRPMFVPSPQEIRAMTPRQDGIVPFQILVQFQVSDDGKTALAEFMSFDRKVLLPILTSAAPGVKVFEKGVARTADIQAEFVRVKQSFTPDSMTPTRAVSAAAIQAAGAAK
jgi:D-alanine-D-alanine ligase-like ATP-grasp enzyme